MASKGSSQDGNRLKKMPPDNGSKAIPHYTVHDSKYVMQTTYDSGSSNDDEPDQKTSLPEEANQKLRKPSHGEVLYPPIPPSGSLADNDNFDGGGPLQRPVDVMKLQRKSGSRTPSPVKKSQSNTIRPKAVEEVRTAPLTKTSSARIKAPEEGGTTKTATTSTARAKVTEGGQNTQMTTTSTDPQRLNRDVNDNADFKPQAPNDNSRGQLDGRNRAWPSLPHPEQIHDHAHIAARPSHKDKLRTRESFPDVLRTEPKLSVMQRAGRGVAQAFYGPSPAHSDPRQYYDPEQELRELKTTLQKKDTELQALKIKVNELQYSLAMAEEAQEDIIRKQQEANFKQMDTGRWLPQEESKIKGDLDRLKRLMKSWSKDCSIDSMNTVGGLIGGTDAEVALTQCLSNVMRLHDGQLPLGLNPSKAPSLLLNALVADDVYKSVFENPFFFLRDLQEHNLPKPAVAENIEQAYQVISAEHQLVLDEQHKRLAPEYKFNEIYQAMLAVNGREAHIWRSQTLRLLYPPLRENSTNEEINLHSLTDSHIFKVSEWLAERFANGPARHLINIDPEGLSIQKVKLIYKQAADLSYQLWARRTLIKCITLREMGPLATFAIDNPYMEPHTLVRYDDHADQLFGKPFTVVVHPIVEAYGTDEGDGYDQKGRVWAKAVVWLDSRTDNKRS